MPSHVAYARKRQDVAMMSVVHDWHELHRFNVHEERKEAAGTGGAAA